MDLAQAQLPLLWVGQVYLRLFCTNPHPFSPAAHSRPMVIAPRNEDRRKLFLLFSQLLELVTSSKRDLQTNLSFSSAPEF